jgi:hypothetical protein
LEPGEPGVATIAPPLIVRSLIETVAPSEIEKICAFVALTVRFEAPGPWITRFLPIEITLLSVVVPLMVKSIVSPGLAAATAARRVQVAGQTPGPSPDVLR